MTQDGCLTCGDAAYEAVVLATRGLTAVVDAGGDRTEVALELVAPVEPGDALLCHAGIALRKVPR